ncbi:uncharacterized protein BROUX77_004023 [Berkeleyomyces rouxiae]|uniref:uncharacterized protein n=1 Tax=Berkeleyomyces rouxiae TaxID=2035830 RepID=UPI003B76EA26
MPSPSRPHSGPAPQKPSSSTSTSASTNSAAASTNSAACFASSTLVTLASGAKVPMRHLRRGMRVQTPLGPRRVAALLMTVVTDLPVCDVRGVLVTAWHPVSHEATSWHFPRWVASGHGRYTGRMCSVLLEKDPNPRAHAVWVSPAAPAATALAAPAAPAATSTSTSTSQPPAPPHAPYLGFWGVTLGHGLRKPNRHDVRAHPFFGDYAVVVRNLISLGVGEGGIVMSGGVLREQTTGLAVGFAPPRSSRSSMVTLYVKVPNPLARHQHLVKEARRRVRLL